MPRLAFIFAVMVLAAAAALCLPLWHSEPEVVPMTRLQPAVPRQQPAAAAPASAAPALLIAAVVTDTQPATAWRDAVPAQTSDRSTELVVLLQDEQELPLPAVDLLLRSDDQQPPLSMVCNTDATGRASFAVPASAERRLQLAAAGLGQASFQLQPGDPVTVVLRVPVRARLRGQVLLADGRPVADANIVFVPAAGDRSLARQLARTDHDGRFRAVIASSGLVGAEHQELAPSALQPVRCADPGEPAIERELQLRLLGAQAKVQGTVVDTGGHALAGVQLEFRSRSSRNGRLPATPPQTTVSAADGSFAVANLPAGELCWVASAAGHSQRAGALATRAGETTTCRIELPPAAGLLGVVRDRDGKPVAQASIRAAPELTPLAAWCSQALTVTACSAADGSFAWPELAPGRWQLQASSNTAPGLVAQATVELVAGQQLSCQLTLAKAGPAPELRGRILDESNRPLADYQVLVLAQDQLLGVDASDANGEFSVATLATEPEELLVYGPDQPLSGFPLKQQSCRGQRELVLVVPLRRATASLRGRIASATQGPVAATLTLWHHGLARSAVTTADAAGSFTFPDVPPGTVDLLCSHSGHASLSQRGIALQADQVLDLGLWTLATGASLHGNVLLAAGNAPAQLEVYAVTAEGERIFGVYAGGQYRLDDLPAGRLWLHAQGPQVAAAAFAVELEAGVAMQRDMQLRAGLHRQIEVHATAAAGRRISLSLLPASNARTTGERPAVQAAHSSALPSSGKLSFDAWMAPGDYEVVVQSDAGWFARAPLRFAAGDSAPLRLSLQPR